MLTQITAVLMIADQYTWLPNDGMMTTVQITASKIIMRRGILFLPVSLYQNLWLGMHPSRAMAHMSCAVL